MQRTSTMRSLPIAIISFTFALLVSACGGGGGSSSPPPPPAPISAPSALSYTSPQTYNVGTAITALNATVTGTVTSFSVSPALPAGLVLNTVNGQITGTPTIVTAMASYTITATNGTGSTTFVLVLTINPPAPSALSYTSPQTYVTGTAITALNAAVTGTVTSYSVSPALPTGLVLNTTTGQIAGTPTTATAMASYTITATNGSGSTTFALALTVNPLPPVATTVTVSYGVKQVILNWTAVTGATYYQVSKRTSSTSSYTQLGSNLTVPAVSYTDTVAVHLTDWINVSYIVAACNSGGCTNSAAISALDTKQAIGYFKASNTEAYDNFGQTMALSADGNTLAVSSISEASNATGINGNQSDNSKGRSGAVYVFTRSSGGWSQQAYIKASNTDADDYFGSSVALSADGNTLVVSAYQESSNATGIPMGINGQADNSSSFSGAVYVFTRSGSSWSQQAYVKASNTDANDNFGYAMALSTDGNTLAVGAPGEASNATGIPTGVNGQSNNSNGYSGAVYVFTRSGSSWTQQAYVKASNSETNDNFGSSLALNADGNTLAVGAIFEDSGAITVNGNQLDNTKSASGAVYVFLRSANSWTQQAYVKASNTDVSDYFGTTVALSADGNTLAVSSTSEASNATGIGGVQSDNSKVNAGAVYVFTRSSSSWTQQAYVKASNTDAGDNFGVAVSLSGDGNILAVGATLEDSIATGINGTQTDNTKSGSGAAYVFTRNGITWSQQAYVKAPSVNTSNQFGSSVSLSADGATLAVGAFGESSNATGVNGNQSDNSLSQSGAVYVY